MYEGMIALAWADHALDAQEKQGLHDLIDSNTYFSDQQRAKLHEDVDQQITIEGVWPRITEKKDRARLLDIAGVIFMKDGKLCETEQELYNTFLEKHLSTLDNEATLKEIREMAAQQKAARAQQQADLEEYAKRFSLVERIKQRLSLWTD